MAKEKAEAVLEWLHKLGLGVDKGDTADQQAFVERADSLTSITLAPSGYTNKDWDVEAVSEPIDNAREAVIGDHVSGDPELFKRPAVPKTSD